MSVSSSVCAVVSSPCHDSEAPLLELAKNFPDARSPLVAFFESLTNAQLYQFDDPLSAYAVPYLESLHRQFHCRGYLALMISNQLESEFTVRGLERVSSRGIFRQQTIDRILSDPMSTSIEGLNLTINRAHVKLASEEVMYVIDCLLTRVENFFQLGTMLALQTFCFQMSTSQGQRFSVIQERYRESPELLHYPDILSVVPNQGCTDTFLSVIGRTTALADRRDFVDYTQTDARIVNRRASVPPTSFRYACTVDYVDSSLTREEYDLVRGDPELISGLRYSHDRRDSYGGSERVLSLNGVSVRLRDFVLRDRARLRAESSLDSMHTLEFLGQRAAFLSESSESWAVTDDCYAMVLLSLQELGLQDICPLLLYYLNTVPPLVFGRLEVLRAESHTADVLSASSSTACSVSRVLSTAVPPRVTKQAAWNISNHFHEFETRSNYSENTYPCFPEPLPYGFFLHSRTGHEFIPAGVARLDTEVGRSSLCFYMCAPADSFCRITIDEPGARSSNMSVPVPMYRMTGDACFPDACVSSMIPRHWFCVKLCPEMSFSRSVLYWFTVYSDLGVYGTVPFFIGKVRNLHRTFPERSRRCVSTWTDLHWDVPLMDSLRTYPYVPAVPEKYMHDLD
jgi:hypothetical protein